MFKGTQYFAQFGCTDHFPTHLPHNLFNRLHDGQPPPSSCPRGRLCPYSHDEAVALLAASKGVAVEGLPQAAPTTPAPLAPAPAPVPSARNLLDLFRLHSRHRAAAALAGAGGLPLSYQSLGAAPQPLPASSSTSSSYSTGPPFLTSSSSLPSSSSSSTSSSSATSGYQARPSQPSASAGAGAYNPHASLVATLTAMSARLSAPPAPTDVSAASYEQPTAPAPAPAKKPLLLGRRREGLRGLSALRGTGAKSSLPSMGLALPKKKPASRPEPKNLVSAKPSASEGGLQRAAQGPTTGPKQAAKEPLPPQAGDKRKLDAPARTAPPSAQLHPRSRTAAQSLVAATAATSTSPPAGGVKRARIEPSAPMDEYDPLLPMGGFDSPLNLSGDDDGDDDDDDVLPLKLEAEAKATKAAAAAPLHRAPQLLKRVPTTATTTATTAMTKATMTSSARPAGAPGAQRVTLSAGQSRPTSAGQMPGFYRKRPAEPDDPPPERALEVKGAQLQLAVEKHKRMMAQRAGQASSSSTGSHAPRPSGSQLYAPVLPSTLAAGAGASSLSAAPSSLPYAFSTSSSFTPAYSSSSSSSSLLAPTLPTSTSAIARPSVNRSAASSSSGSTRLAKLRKDMPVLVRPAAARTPSATATAAAATAATTATTSAASLAPVPGQQRQRQPTAADKQRAMLDQRKKHLEDKQRQRDEAEKRRHQAAAHAARQASSLGLGPPHSASAAAAAPQQQQQQMQQQMQQVVAMSGGAAAENEEDDMEEVEYRELQGKPRDIVPAPRYPTVAFDLKPKVPRAVRQAVLDKFLEETLRHHHFLHFALDNCEGQPDDAWMQTAIDEAVRLETEQYQKCQSKGVYVNLCAKAMQALKRGE